MARINWSVVIDPVEWIWSSISITYWAQIFVSEQVFGLHRLAAVKMIGLPWISWPRGVHAFIEATGNTSYRLRVSHPFSYRHFSAFSSSWNALGTSKYQPARNLSLWLTVKESVISFWEHISSSWSYACLSASVHLSSTHLVQLP